LPNALVPWNESDRRGDPLKLGISLDEAEIVESIVDHYCPPLQRGEDTSSWTCRVRFVGCGPEEDAWVPFAATRPLSAFGTYLKENPDLHAALAYSLQHSESAGASSHTPAPAAVQTLPPDLDDTPSGMLQPGWSSLGDGADGRG